MSPKLLKLLLLVLTFTIYYLVISPLYTGKGALWQPEKSIGALRDLNAQYDQTLSQADDLYKQAEQLRREYAAIDETSKQKMLKMVPKSIDPVRLLSELNIIAAASGISLGGVSYSDTAKEINLAGGYQLSFTIKTSYQKFKEFMSNYENSLRLFTLHSVAFSAPEKETDLISFQVRLTTYYLK